MSVERREFEGFTSHYFHIRPTLAKQIFSEIRAGQPRDIMGRELIPGMQRKDSKLFDTLHRVSDAVNKILGVHGNGQVQVFGVCAHYLISKQEEERGREIFPVFEGTLPRKDPWQLEEVAREEMRRGILLQWLQLSVHESVITDYVKDIADFIGADTKNPWEIIGVTTVCHSLRQTYGDKGISFENI